MLDSLRRRSLRRSQGRSVAVPQRSNLMSTARRKRKNQSQNAERQRAKANPRKPPLGTPMKLNLQSRTNPNLLQRSRAPERPRPLSSTKTKTELNPLQGSHPRRRRRSLSSKKMMMLKKKKKKLQPKTGSLQQESHAQRSLSLSRLKTMMMSLPLKKSSLSRAITHDEDCCCKW